MTGTSWKRGTRYCSIEPFWRCPSANAIASNSAPPSPWTTEPSTWFFKPSGFTIAPHSKAITMRSTLNPLPAFETSAAVAT